MSKLRHVFLNNGCYFVTTATHNRKPIFVDSSIIQIVRNSFYFLRNEGRFYLFGYIIMPDHMHLLIALRGKHSLSQVMHSIKSYTAKEINNTLSKDGKIWQDGYYEHTIRDEKDCMVKLRYLLENPVRKGLVEKVEDYPFSSINDEDIDSIWG
jgi:putative transposase